MQLTGGNISNLVETFDVIIDGTDNVATRYLLNDACVLRNKPLVSGSALQMEGQLTVYHYRDGPCYRCLFPIPPPPEAVTSCGDGGVLGAGIGVKYFLICSIKLECFSTWMYWRNTSIGDDKNIIKSA